MNAELNNSVREMDNAANVVSAWLTNRDPESAWNFLRTFGLVGRYNGKTPTLVVELLLKTMNATKDELLLNVLAYDVAVRAPGRMESLMRYLKYGQADYVTHIVNRADDELMCLAKLDAEQITPAWSDDTTYVASAIALAALCGKFRVSAFDALRAQARDRAETFHKNVTNANTYVRAAQLMYKLIGN